MRDRETIDSELRQLAAELRSTRERGGRPSSQRIDALLDERLGHPVDMLFDTAVLDEICPPAKEADVHPPRRRPGLLPRLAVRAAVPLCLITIAAAVAVMFALHHRHRATEQTVSPPSDEPPATTEPAPAFVPAATPASPTDIAEKAMTETLQREGVPVPSHDYVVNQGHAVCDFLGRQPNVNDAAHFVQQSTVWDAGQSADFVTAAVITYCPKFESAFSDQMQQTYQKSLTNLQSIEGDLRGINNDLQDIKDALPGGH